MAFNISRVTAVAAASSYKVGNYFVICLFIFLILPLLGFFSPSFSLAFNRDILRDGNKLKISFIQDKRGHYPALLGNAFQIQFLDFWRPNSKIKAAHVTLQAGSFPQPPHTMLKSVRNCGNSQVKNGFTSFQQILTFLCRDARCMFEIGAGTLAQWLAHWISNPMMDGSNPGRSNQFY